MCFEHSAFYTIGVIYFNKFPVRLIIAVKLISLIWINYESLMINLTS